MAEIPVITEVPDLAVTSLPELMQELHEVEPVHANDYPWFSPPFHYVPMPLNADENGPEMDAANVVRTEHQVWNAECEVVAVCPTEQVAKFVVAGLRRVRPPAASDDDEIEAAGGDRVIADLLVRWQTDQSNWFSNTILEIVAEYAAWRERQSPKCGVCEASIFRDELTGTRCACTP